VEKNKTHFTLHIRALKLNDTQIFGKVIDMVIYLLLMFFLGIRIEMEKCLTGIAILILCKHG